MKDLLIALCNLVLPQDEHVTRQSLMGAENRRLIAQEIENCRTLADLARLQSAFSWCVADFTHAQFLDTLRDIEHRRVMLEQVDDIFKGRTPNFIAIVRRMDEADFDALQVLFFAAKINRAVYTPLEWHEIETRYFLRMETIGMPTQPNLKK